MTLINGPVLFWVGTLDGVIGGGNVSQQQPNCALSEYCITINAVYAECIGSDFTWSAYNNGQIANYTVASKIWQKPPPVIAIGIVASTSIHLFTPLTVITITIVVIIAIVIVFLLLYRRHRKRSNLKQ